MPYTNNAIIVYIFKMLITTLWNYIGLNPLQLSQKGVKGHGMVIPIANVSMKLRCVGYGH